MISIWSRVIFLLPVFFSLALTGCYSTAIPLDNQKVLDKVGLVLPDTRFPTPKSRDAVLPVLLKKGFHWNNPRYTLGHHLIKGNRIVVMASSGHLSVLRYDARFTDSGFRIYRYVPSKSGDIEHQGLTTSPSLLRCLYNRPAVAFTAYHKISLPTFLADGLFGGAINTLISPVLVIWCEASDRLPLTFKSVTVSEDRKLAHLLNLLEEQSKKAENAVSVQKGNPIPTKVTTPASVE